MFVTCCVVGAVTLVSQAKLSRGPILRDVSFYLFVASFMLSVMYSGKFGLWLSLLLLLAYLMYAELPWRWRNLLAQRLTCHACS